MKAKVRIVNGFLNNNDPTTFLLSCEVLEGSIDDGDLLVLDNINKFKIQKVEWPIKDLASNRILTIKDEGKGVKYSILYGRELDIITK